MDAAEPARGEYADAGALGEVRGGGDGRRTVRLAGSDHREVPDAALGDVRRIGEPLQRGVVEADVHLPAEDRDRGGRGAVVADDLFDLARDTQIVRPGQAVGDDRALERDDGRLRVERTL